MQALEVAAEAMDEIFDRMSGLIDAVKFLFGIFFTIGLRLTSSRYDLEPDVDDRSREHDREVEQEHCGPQFDHAEVLKVQIENILPLLLFFGCFGFLLGCELVSVFFQIQLKDVIYMSLLADGDIPLSLHKRVLAVFGEDFA